MTTLRIETAPVFEPLLQPSRYKGAYGGRGSGKSHFFAENVIEYALMTRGFRGLCGREIQKSLKDSAKFLIESKLAKFGLGEAHGFKVFREVIETPGDGAIMFQGLQDHTADSIKSFEGIDVFWGEEAQSLSARSLSLLRPTIRKEGSELWFGWNPTRKSDPVDQMLRGGNTPTGSIVVRANWSDNPWFPGVLEQERQDCLRTQPDQYAHIWEGDYATVLTGAYYAKHLQEAREQGRLGKVARDPLIEVKAFWDIGFSDATAIWIAQFIGREIRVLDYYEAQGQPLAAHLNWLRANGHENALCVLPHDGAHGNAVTGIKFEDHIRAAGFKAQTIENQGRGAAMKRIEATRRLFPSIWFNEATCQAGLDALGWYHEKRDEARGIGLGPDHDWSSHCFTGDTKVLTRYGMRPISSLPYTGEVLAPCGWKQYIAPRITRRDAQLVEVRFTSGFTARCTPDHLFLTESGWKSAESLAPNTAIQSTLTNSRSILMASYIACGRVKSIFPRAVAAFTGILGLLRLGQSQAVATSTTGTGIQSTTGWTILSAWMHLSIFRLVGGRAKGLPFRQVGIFPPWLEKSQLNGTDQKRAVFGTGDKPSAQSLGLNVSVRRGRASAAGFFSWPSFGKPGTLQSIARHLASKLHIDNGASRTNMRVVIESVKPLSETADVWCLTVPEGECFSLANGAVVHNCADAFGLMAVAYEAPRERQRSSVRVLHPQGAWLA
jgi:phage terminase large subunit